MSYANANEIQAAMILLDQEKAFDKVDWNLLFKAQNISGMDPK